MCQHCFQIEYDKFNSENEFNLFMSVFYSKLNNSIFYNGNKNNGIKSFAIYNCKYCNTNWCLSEPDLSWRGFLLKDINIQTIKYKKTTILIFISLSILILFLIFGCNENTPIKKFSEINLIDNHTNKLYLDTATRVTIAETHPLFIGKIQKNIELNYNYFQVTEKFNSLKKHNNPYSNSITIFVDTTKKIGTTLNVFEYLDTEKRNNKIAYPIFIKNKTKDTLTIGYGDIIPLIIEAKDNNQIWKPIQRKIHFECGTGIMSFILPPNNCVISFMKLYSGNFKTKLRLKYEYKDISIYSNEIDGIINSDQFIN